MSWHIDGKLRMTIEKSEFGVGYRSVFSVTFTFSMYCLRVGGSNLLKDV